MDLPSVGRPTPLPVYSMPDARSSYPQAALPPMVAVTNHVTHALLGEADQQCPHTHACRLDVLAGEWA